MTVEELYTLPINDRLDRRLIHGHLVERPYPFRCPAHGMAVANLCGIFGNWEKTAETNGWVVYGHGCPYRLDREPDTFITFDTSVITRALDAATSRKSMFIDGRPTVAIEVLDLSDPEEAVAETVHVATSRRIPLTWLIDPFEEMVREYRPGRPVLVLGPPDDLVAPELPGFKCRVAEIFE